MADNNSRAGARYATPEIIRYLERVHVPHDEALARAFNAPEMNGMPSIQLGPSEAKMLSLILRLVAPKKVVEVGTLAGYSAIHLARGLENDGHLWSIEFEPKHAEIARRNIAEAGLDKRVTVLVGAALDVLPTLEAHGPFDAVFIDADKGNYDKYGRWAAAHLRRGGLLLGDNAYYFGQLLEQGSAEAQAMRRFHEDAAKAFQSVCVPTPDGLLLGIKN